MLGGRKSRVPRHAFDRRESDGERAACGLASLAPRPVDNVLVHRLAVDGNTALELAVLVEPPLDLVVGILVLGAGEELAFADEVFPGPVRAVIPERGADRRFDTACQRWHGEPQQCLLQRWGNVGIGSSIDVERQIRDRRKKIEMGAVTVGAERRPF